jgi:hypothetical protein
MDEHPMLGDPVVFEYPSKPVVLKLADVATVSAYIILADRAFSADGVASAASASVSPVGLPFILKAEQSPGCFNFRRGDHLKVVLLEAAGPDSKIYWETELDISEDLTELAVPFDSLKALEGRSAKIRYYVTTSVEGGAKSVTRTSAAAYFEVRGLGG